MGGMTKKQISVVFQRIPSEPELVSKDMDPQSVSGDLCAVHSWEHLPRGTIPHSCGSSVPVLV